MRHLSVKGPRLTVRGVSLSGNLTFYSLADMSQNANYSRAENIDSTGQVNIIGSDDIAVINSKIKPTALNANPIAVYPTNHYTHPPTNVLVENNEIGPAWASPDYRTLGVHNQSIHIMGGSNVTFRRNLILEGGTSSTLQIDADLGTLSGILIENNYIAGCGLRSPPSGTVCEAFYAVQYSGNYTGVTSATVLRNNTIRGGIIDSSFTQSGVSAGDLSGSVVDSGVGCAGAAMHGNLLGPSSFYDCSRNVLGVPSYTDPVFGGISWGMASGSAGFGLGVPAGAGFGGTGSPTPVTTTTTSTLPPQTTTTTRPTTTDTQAPTVAITSPSGGSTVGGATSIATSASDNVGVARVDLAVDGVVAMSMTSPPFTGTWSTGSSTNGSHTLTAKAYDAAGNVGTSSGVAVNVNNSVTTSTFGATSPGSSRDRAGLGYKFGSVYPLSEPAVVSSFSFYAAGGTEGQRFTPAIYNVDAAGLPSSLVAKGQEVLVPAVQTAGWFTATMPTTSLAAGRYMTALISGAGGSAAYLYFADEAGTGIWNENTYPAPTASWGAANFSSQRWSFKVGYSKPTPPADTQRPTVTITTPSNGATVSGVVSVSSTATDNVAVARVDLLVDGVVQASVTSAPYTFSWSTAGVVNGSHTLGAKAYDAAGNTSTSPTVTVTVTNAPPPPVFGATVPGTSANVSEAGFKFGSTYTLGVAATVTDFKFHASGGARAQKFTPVIYKVNNSGQPSSLAVRGQEVTVPAGQAAGWVTSTLPATTLPAGRYLLALLAGPTSNGASVSYTSEAQAGNWNSNAYPTPSKSWGTTNVSSLRWSFAVSYRAA